MFDSIDSRVADNLSDRAEEWGLTDAQAVDLVILAFQHTAEGGCVCPGCLRTETAINDGTIAQVNPNGLLDTIDWGGPDNAVDSGDYQADGTMVIEYYFVPGGGYYQGIFPRQDWTDYEKQQVDLAFGTYEAVIDVEFVETDVRSDAEFELNKINSFGLFLGVMNPPGEAAEGSAGFWGSANSPYWDSGDGAGGPTTGELEQGGYGFVTLVHEFGHGLGLAHPHDTGGDSSVMPGVSDPFTDTGDYDLNQGIYTTMSYVDGWATNPDGPPPDFSYGYQGTPMALDIAVLQQKYGANMDYNTGDDVYQMPETNEIGTFYSCIWDAGGTDTIAYGGSADVVIDLRPATLEFEEGGGGWLSYAAGIHGGFTIANGVVIENATGGAGNDALIENAADNVLTGNGGADTFIFTPDGGGDDTIADFEDGTDLVDVSGYGWIPRSAVTATWDAGGTTLEAGGESILFAGTRPSELGLDDFILA